MARTRSLKPGFFKNEFLGQLPFEARLLFEGLWCIADRRGVLEDRPLRIKAEIFPFDNVDVEALLTQLSTPIDAFQDHPFIVRYEVDGKRYILIKKFEEHQTPHHQEKPSEAPLPQTVTPQEFANSPEAALDKSGASSVQDQDEHRTNPSGTLNPLTGTLNLETGNGSTPEEPAVSGSDVASQVQQVVDAYCERHPRAKPGDKERKLIRARLKEGHTPQDLIDAIEGCHLSEFHNGANDGGAKYQKLSLILRNADNVAAFIEKFDEKRGKHRTRGRPRIDYEQWRAALVKKLRDSGKDIPSDEKLREHFENLIAKGERDE